jgi:signal transduction histidine kinase
MRERAKEFGGELRVSNADPGTLVEVVIPSSVLVSQQPVIAL